MRKPVIKFERIHEDKDGAWPLDDYFEYIESVASLMPVGLREFATSFERYQLRGKCTLHDCRMLSITVSKKMHDGGVSNDTALDVTLLDQFFEGRICLHYGGVSSFEVAESQLLNRRGSDVLLHEFSVLTEGRFRHAVLFDGGGGYAVEFSKFSHS